MLNNVSRGLNARLHLKERSAEEQKALTEIQLQRLERMQEECDEVLVVLNVQ